MMLSRRSALPLYHQLREQIREKIEAGEWQPGFQLPSEVALAATYEVSRATVRQAMQLLEEDGLVERIQGRGTFVGRPKVAQDLSRLMTFRSSLVPAGWTVVSRFIHLRRVAPSYAVSRQLGITQEEEVYEIKRVAIVDDEPLGVLTVWMPTSLFPGLEERDPRMHSPIYTLRAYYGDDVSIHQHREVEVTFLDDSDAQLLNAIPGSPAILLTQTSYFEGSRAFECRRTILRGDRCKYYIDVDFDGSSLDLSWA